MRFLTSGVRALFVAVLAAFVITTVQPAQPVAAAEPAQKVIASARHHLGAPWVWGQIGPRSFDCSGLVYHAFKEAGVVSRIGGIRSARGLYSYFRNRGLATRSGARLGDLVVWGGGSHVGIYIGNGYAISTLRSGVRIHRVHAVTAPFTAYLHTRLASSGATTSSTSATRWTTAPVNLRTGPGTNYAIKVVLPSGFELTVLGSARDSLGRKWFRVNAGSRTGYVASWYTRS